MNTQYHINPTGNFRDWRARLVTPDLQEERLLLIPMVVWQDMEVVHFLEKTHPRSIEVLPMLLAMLQKTLLLLDLLTRCEIQVSYAIGVADPTSISVDTFGTGRKLPNYEIERSNQRSISIYAPKV